ncbi:MAG: hypothetical protein IJ716_14375 [Lachnospiraceae bacterium]|nr:hypothetical protein [Lachnospiraceae bacterium]
MDYRLLDAIETIGFVNKHGQHVYGSAAVLHFLYTPVKSINPSLLESGKEFVDKHIHK